MVSVCANSSLHLHLGHVFCVTQVAHRFGAFVFLAHQMNSAVTVVCCALQGQEIFKEKKYILYYEIGSKLGWLPRDLCLKLKPADDWRRVPSLLKSPFNPHPSAWGVAEL